VFGFTIETLIGRLIGLAIGFTLHEWAHAWTAYRQGDNTAYYQGRLTLDPRAHLDPIGLILALIAGFGWAKPVPVNPYAFYPNQKRGLVIVSLAGPLMNLFIAFGVGLVVRLMIAAGLIDVVAGTFIRIDSGFIEFIYRVIEAILIFNLVLFVFNLLPLAPLDGYKIAVGVLPPQYSDPLIRYERETTLALMLLIILGAMSSSSPLGVLLFPPIRFFFELFSSIPL
jgi:Zn-dependent protease